MPDKSVWRYRVGKTDTRLVAPDGKSQVVSNAEIKGIRPQDFERGRWKQTSDGSIYPSEIRRWIEAFRQLDKSTNVR